MTDKPCLHCEIARVVRRYFDEHGERTSDGVVVVDVSEATGKLCEVIAELAGQIANRPDRRRFRRFAKECLEAAFRFEATGEEQVVDLGTPEVLQ